MKEEEKQELEELRTKDTLTDEETARAATLEELEAADQPLTDEEEFNAAFAEATNEEPPKKAESVENLDDGKAKKKEGKPEDSKTKEPDQKKSIFNKTPEKDSGEGDEGTESRIAKLEAALAKEQQRTRSWEGRIEAANKRAEEAEDKLSKQNQNGQEKKKSPDEGDAEDDALLEEFIEEFPSLEGPIRVLIRKEGKRIARDIVEEKMKDLKPSLEKVNQTLETNEEEAEQRHFNMIKEKHSDYLEIYESGALRTWIDNQPKFLQTTLNVIVEEGDAEEIIEMLTAYKDTANYANKSDNSGKDKQSRKLEKLEVVESSSAGPPKQKKKIEKDDFDSAWEDALSKK